MEVPLLERNTANDGRLMESWLKEVRGSLGGQSIVHWKEVIYPVPFCLKNKETELFYHPKVICFGPEHFRKYVPYDYVVEGLKTDVSRKFDLLLKSAVNGGDKAAPEDDGLIGVVEKFKSEEMQKRFVQSYAIQYRSLISNDEVVSWLLVRDACFVIEILERFSSEDQDEGKVRQKLSWEHVLNRKNHHPLLNDIVKDMFKLENQLPLWVLQEIRKQLRWPVEGNWFEFALKNLSPVEVKEAVGSRTYSKEVHILQLLGEYMVDNRAEESNSTASQEYGNYHNQEDLESGPNYSTGSQGDGNYHNQEVKVPVSYASTANHKEEKQGKLAKYIIAGIEAVFYVFLFLILLPFLIIWSLWSVICFMWFSYRNSTLGKAEKNEKHVPTIQELDKIGVKFEALDSKGISQIKFKEKRATLYLPKFTVDDKSEVILRNLLVMETHWEDTEKIITRYVVFMNDLVNTSEDVFHLRKQGIIVNNLGSDDDVARLWNSVTIPATDIPVYEPIDKAAEHINAYRKKWWRVLWAQFWRLHCSKPWLVASLLGGMSLLSLTVVQVVCLFRDCQKG